VYKFYARLLVCLLFLVLGLLFVFFVFWFWVFVCLFLESRMPHPLFKECDMRMRVAANAALNASWLARGKG